MRSGLLLFTIGLSYDILYTPALIPVKILLRVAGVKRELKQIYRVSSVDFFKDSLNVLLALGPPHGTGDAYL